MNIQPFKLERYFAQHEFNTKHLLCTSDCETMSVEELLALEPKAHEQLLKLRLGYTESHGDPKLRERVAELYDHISSDDVLIHAGQEGILLFMLSCLEQGDHIIVQYPTYQSLFSLAQDRGIDVTLWKGDPDDSWELDLQFLRDTIRPNTKAVVINMPNNPTGYIMSREKFDELINIVKEKDLILFSDEAYRFLEHNKCHRLPSAADVYDKAVSLFVMSKGFGLPGLRIAWNTTRNKKLMKKMATMKDFTTICSSGVSEFLATLALRNLDVILSKNRALIASNLALLNDFFARHTDMFEWREPKGASIAFVRLRSGSSSVFCKDLLEKKGVLLLPSECYEMGDEHFRIGFGRKSMPEALALLEDYVKEKS